MSKNVLIRNIPSADVKILDDLAREKGIPREEYIRQLIHGHVSGYFMTDDLVRMEELTRKNISVIEINNEVLKKLASAFTE